MKMRSITGPISILCRRHTTEQSRSEAVHITFEPVTEELEPEVRQTSVFLLDDLTDVLERVVVTVQQGLTLRIVKVVLQKVKQYINSSNFKSAK